jgi:uncharacterized membrane protein
MTPPAVVAIAAYAGALALPPSLAWMGGIVAVVAFGLLATGELVADKLPIVPARTSPPALIARMATGGLSGACLAAAAGAGTTVGALLGAAGAVVGAFAGYRARMRLTDALGTPDVVIAMLEDVATVGGALLLVSRL